MDTAIEELENCECVSSVITTAYVLYVERESMGPMEILLRINDGVYAYINTIINSQEDFHGTH